MHVSRPNFQCVVFCSRRRMQMYFTSTILSHATCAWSNFHSSILVKSILKKNTPEITIMRWSSLCIGKPATALSAQLVVRRLLASDRSDHACIAVDPNPMTKWQNDVGIELPPASCCLFWTSWRCLSKVMPSNVVVLTLISSSIWPRNSSSIEPSINVGRATRKKWQLDFMQRRNHHPKAQNQNCACLILSEILY